MPDINAKRVIVAAIHSGTCRVWQTDRVELTASCIGNDVFQNADAPSTDKAPDVVRGHIELAFQAEPVKRQIALDQKTLLALAVLMGDDEGAKILADMVLLGE